MNCKECLYGPTQCYFQENPSKSDYCPMENLSTPPQSYTKEQIDEAKLEFEENKFIVINRKRFNELNSEESIMAGLELIDCISRFRQAYEKDTGKKMDQRYIVCNQDEPYAERVKAIILGTEAETVLKEAGVME